ncbi:diacylglycerol O-acyltransferase 2-like [Rhincodon typus]|uniref:diacylglycerol O-acyltransferase 2-like n=1 Tax=Rhincodon typus TaxID=259920 RepID=UPI00202E1C0B|nr:diacylglycerol O-acyltransferase 2-like [Rhincodon typus]
MIEPGKVNASPLQMARMASFCADVISGSPGQSVRFRDGLSIPRNVFLVGKSNWIDGQTGTEGFSHSPSPLAGLLTSFGGDCRMMLRRLLETLSVFQWVLTFLLLGVFGSLLTVYLLLTRFWPIAALYLAWLTIDNNTPERGGRRSQWVRSWAVWRYMRDYFPVSIVKMAELDPKRNYVFGSHPHGIMCVGAFCNFCTEATGFSRVFPGITPHLATLSGLFCLPILRDYLLSGGGCSVSKSSLGHILSQRGMGNAVVIVVGGAAESMAGAPGVHSVLLKNRKGFVRLALTHG